MSIIFPDGVASEGNVKVVYVTTVADTDAPTAAEANAAGGVDLTPYIKAGTFQPGGEQSALDDRRLSSRQTFETPGRIKYSIDDLTYVYDPQAAAAAPGNLAQDKLTPGTNGFLVVRWGTANEGVFVLADLVDVYPVTCGAQRKQAPGDSAEGEKLTIVQKLFVRGTVQQDVAIAA